MQKNEPKNDQRRESKRMLSRLEETVGTNLVESPWKTGPTMPKDRPFELAGERSEDQVEERVLDTVAEFREVECAEFIRDLFVE